MVTCDCGARNYTERTVLDGVTYSADEFFALGPSKIGVSNDEA